MSDEMNIHNMAIQGNLFVTAPEGTFADYLAEIMNLVTKYPEILKSIEKDQLKYKQNKKKQRLEDLEFKKQMFEQKFDGFEQNTEEIQAEKLRLSIGRPGMTSLSVYLFLMLRGYLGSVTTQSVWQFVKESMSLMIFMQNNGIKMPGRTTILENLNAISSDTHELILQKQLNWILKEDLDCFTTLTIDSTSVKANSAWPTDSKIIYGLLERAFRMSQKLHMYGVENVKQWYCPKWLKELHAADFEINLVCGKPGSKKKIKKLYRKIFKIAQKMAAYMKSACDQISALLELDKIMPSIRKSLIAVIEQIKSDISDSLKVVAYGSDRVFNERYTDSKEKILSLSDSSAAFIKKGGREAVIGYKPQLVRSENGFIVHLEVPEGNAADSAQFAPCICAASTRTGIIPVNVSSDDGYASKSGLNTLKNDLGVETVSISGSKGKRLTDPEIWDSEMHKNLRNDRSAVESLMFTVKHNHNFGRVGRRNIEAVRDELLEKVIAYNFVRIMSQNNRNAQGYNSAA